MGRQPRPLTCCQHLQVRTVPVTTRLVPLSELRVAAPRVDELTSIEASLRLDAIASAGACCRPGP
jgi:RNA-binding protein YlmH